MFVSAKVNYGTEFYLYDASELRNRYKSAKEKRRKWGKNGRPTKSDYRNGSTEQPNPIATYVDIGRIGAYRHLTRNEVLDLYGRNFIPENELRIKLNFANFVRRFEQENTNILEIWNAKYHSTKRFQ